MAALTRLGVVLGAIVLAMMLTTSTASAHFPQSIAATIPGGGDAMVTSSTLPANATSATITAKPVDAGATRLFRSLEKILSGGTTRGQRVLLCVLFYAAIKGNFDEKINFGTADPSLTFLFFKTCLEIALAPSAPQAVDAAAGCPRQDVAAPIRVTRSGGKYHLRAMGTARKSRARSALVVSCRPKGSGIQISLRPRSRHRTLRQVVGPNLAIGYVNPSTGQSVRVQTSFGVR